MGVPQVKQNESCEETASLCLKIFAGLGVQEISVQDLDIAHRVPRRDSGSRPMNKPNPIICKFTRRMAKERVMAMKRNTSELTNVSLGLGTHIEFERIGIYEHLSPRMQELFYQAKNLQKRCNFKYCWSKSANIYLKEYDTSRAVRIRSLDDLGRFEQQAQSSRRPADEHR